MPRNMILTWQIVIECGVWIDKLIEHFYKDLTNKSNEMFDSLLMRWFTKMRILGFHEILRWPLYSMGGGLGGWWSLLPYAYLSETITILQV